MVVKTKRELFDVDEHRKYLHDTWKRLQKFQSASTGVPSVDRQVRAAWGPWLEPSVERETLRREIKILEFQPQEAVDENSIERLEYFESRLKEIANTGDSKDGKNSWEIKISKIPFQGDDGNLHFMKLRQLLMWSPPIMDSGCYRITWVGRNKSFSIIDMKTGVKVGNESDLREFLKHFFDPNEIHMILLFLWE